MGLLQWDKTADYQARTEVSDLRTSRKVDEAQAAKLIATCASQSAIPGHVLARNPPADSVEQMDTVLEESPRKRERRDGGGQNVTNNCVAGREGAGVREAVDGEDIGENDSGKEQVKMDIERPHSPISVLDLSSWEDVSGLDSIQRTALNAVASRGVSWTHHTSKEVTRFTLHHGGEVLGDGNCLFTSLGQLLGTGEGAVGAQELREVVVRRFVKGYEAEVFGRVATDQAVKHLYSPDLEMGWGVHFVQELKLLAKKGDRSALDTAIGELCECGMTREAAAESVYKERCEAVADGASWAHYMAVSGSSADEHDIVSLQYTSDGLMAVDENREGRAAAFGDDIAIECAATELGREIFVVQAHGADGMMDAGSSLFFLPHKPRGSASLTGPPLFLLMKGTGWCGAGGDHYEPILAKQKAKSEEGEKPAIAL